ncbi:TetR/AcrR family transcriptional regulator [Nonomuraea sp. NPDC050536]|uniref:TetR/AcrR family transcriptional regulator n=1 Tax=Nonomuraea sp. NPDC050536 TaxID=3364366 RepID=UPI0037CBE9F2
MDHSRADRILDAAAELLLRLGYRKVTVEDIAQRAGIGKGTVYLHWRTKQQLFEALIMREGIGYLEELLAGLREDPAGVLPHRLMAASFLAVHARPVLRAIITGEARELRDIVAASPRRGEDLLATARFMEVLTRHGLFRDDVPDLAYAFTAVHAGFHLLDNLDPAAAEMELRAKAGALAHVVETAFEPASPSPEGVAAAAAEVTAVFEQAIPATREWIYQL